MHVCREEIVLSQPGAEARLTVNLTRRRGDEVIDLAKINLIR